jgi:hypothetical protein
VLESIRTERAAREQSISRLQLQHEQIARRIEFMYLDKFYGRSTQEFFDRQTAPCLYQREGVRVSLICAAKAIYGVPDVRMIHACV